MKNFVAQLVAWGPPGLFLMAVLDSAGIPIPTGVDALLLLLTANVPSSAPLCVALALAGSLLGSMVLFSLARAGGEKYLERHTLSPRARVFREWFQHYGLLTVFISAISPVPLPMKLFVISAGALGIRPRDFLLTVLAARLPRYAALAYLGAQLGHGAGAYLKSHAWQLGGILAALFAVLFGCVKYVDWRRERASAQG